MGFGSKQESHINRFVTLKLQDDYIENASAEIMSMGNLVVFSFLVHRNPPGSLLSRVYCIFLLAALPPEACLVHSEAFVWTDGMGLGWSISHQRSLVLILRAPSLLIITDEWS